MVPRLLRQAHPRRQLLAILLLLLPFLLHPLATAAFSLLVSRATSSLPPPLREATKPGAAGALKQATALSRGPSGVARLVSSRASPLLGTPSNGVFSRYAPPSSADADEVESPKVSVAPGVLLGTASGASTGSSSWSNRKRHLVLVDWSDRLVPYEVAWFAQHALLQHQLLQLDAQQHQQQREREHPIEVLPGIAPRRVTGSTACDFAILTQHPSVYTLGQGSKLSFVGDGLREAERQLLLPQQLQDLLESRQGVQVALQQIGDGVPPSSGGFHEESREERPELVRVERGGEVTWHGPGQLVLYPIFDLRKHRTDVRMYIEALESVAAQTLISLWRDTLPASINPQQQQQRQHQQLAPTSLQHPQQHLQQQEALSSPELQLTRERSMPGVWAAGKKICAVGVRLRRWLSFHGLALNVDNSLFPYQRIVACGLEGKEPTNAKNWLHLLQQQQQPKQSSLQKHHSPSLLTRAARALIGAAVGCFGFSSVAVTSNLSEVLELQATRPP